MNSGCKRRFRFLDTYTVICRHPNRAHKNYKKSSNRIHRLRKIKIVPLHIVRVLKRMMPYWKKQMRLEKQMIKVNSEASVKAPSALSLQRQADILKETKDRLRQQLLNPQNLILKLNQLKA